MHRAHTTSSVGERKFAEKLTILLERGQGILTRVYNIKKVWCSYVYMKLVCISYNLTEGDLVKLGVMVIYTLLSPGLGVQSSLV